MLKAKVGLLSDHPFFAMLALKMQYIADDMLHIPNPESRTMCVDGRTIRYCPAFVDSLSVDELKGVIAHEVMHVAMLHHTRINGRNHPKWNRACDYAINPIILKEARLALPKGALIDPIFTGMSAEEIYSKLPDMPKDNQGQGQGQGNDNPDPGGCGAVAQAPVKSESERHQEEAEVKQMVAQAAAQAKRAGNLPGSLERLIEEVLAPTVNWREVLARFLTVLNRADYTFKRPSPRYLPLYLPVLESIEVGEFVLVLDTSGSTYGIIEKFVAEMHGILNAFGKGFKLIHVDTKVAHVEDIEDEPGKIKIHGGGGTDFVPAFEWLAEQCIEPSALVYLTDGECNSFPAEPEYPVLWATYNNKHFTPPFGEVVPIFDDLEK